MRTTSIKHLLIFIIVFSLVNSTNASDKKQTPLILLSIDGFRYDYVEKYQPPNLSAMIKSGVRAERMLPIYPSKTFPNHISLVTGMYPSNHGIVHNSFYDKELDDVYKMGKAFSEPKWMQATPLWIHAERHGVKSASYFWPESDSTLEGLAASYSYQYNKKTPYIKRVNQIIDWLKLPLNERPSFITSYFSLVDDNGHQFGPDSKQVQSAVLEVDQYIGILLERIEKELSFEVNFVVVSDHGMVEIDTDKKVSWQQLANFDGYKVVNGSTQLMLYANTDTNKKQMKQLVEQLNQKSNKRFQAFLKDDLPKRLNYFNNERIADIIVEARAPIIFSDKKKHGKGLKGTHGYDPTLVPEMDAIFIATGPDFKRGLIIPPFTNIHVFPLLNNLLKLPMPQYIDGDSKVLEHILVHE